MAANLASLRKKRARAAVSAELWQKEIIKGTKKLASWRRREKLYTTLIEKALEEEAKAQPQKPARVVEV